MHQKHSYANIQYKIIHRTLACNEWLKNIKIKVDITCSFCNNVDSIPGTQYHIIYYGEHQDFYNYMKNNIPNFNNLSTVMTK